MCMSYVTIQDISVYTIFIFIYLCCWIYIQMNSPSINLGKG